MSERRRSSSFHESGHAVIAAVLGCRCIEVTVWEDGGGQNRHSLTKTNADSAVILLAGAMAQETAGFSLSVHAVSWDSERLRALVKSETGRDDLNIDRVPILREWMLRTLNLVDAHWPAIEAVAGELFTRRQLRETDIRKALSAAGLAAPELEAVQ